MEVNADVTVSSYLKTNKISFSFILILTTFIYSPVVSLMVKQWYEDPNYSHGFLVPVISGYFLYQMLEDLKKSMVAPKNSGLAVIVMGLLMLMAGYVGTEYFTMRLSLIVLIIGMVIYFFGGGILKKTALPIGFLFFMVPLPAIVYNSFAFPLKLMVAKYSVLFLQAIGIVVVREGNIIMFPNTVLEVADACSGMRSIMSLLALGVAFAFISQDAAWKRWTLVLSSVPIAILINALRVIATGILAQRWGAKAAEGFFHEFAGLVIFGLAIVLLACVAGILRRVGR
jgi:exosortase